MDVYHTGSGKVREEWLSRCREERALIAEMMEEILDLSNLTVALQRVISNQGSSGVDGMNVEELKEWFSGHYKTLRSEVYSNQYRVSPIRGVKISKGEGIDS